MGQTGRRSIATHILAVKIVLAAARFHGFGVTRQRPWITWVNKGNRWIEAGDPDSSATNWHVLQSCRKIHKSVGSTAFGAKDGDVSSRW
jgi:hypothetical protein